MQNYTNLEKALEDNDVKSVRNYLGTLAYACRDFSNGEFDKAVEYAEKELKKRNIILKDTLNGLISTRKKENNDLSDDDFSDSVYELKENFCDERIEELKRIGKILYGKQTEGTNPNLSSHQQKKPLSISMIAIAGVLLVALIVVLVKLIMSR